MSKQKAPCYKPMYDFGACLVCVRSHCPNEPEVKKVKITINGEERVVSGGEVNYEWVVKDMLGYNPKHVYTVSYHSRRDDGSELNGIMSPTSKHIKLEEGMIFNCFYTGNA